MTGIWPPSPGLATTCIGSADLIVIKYWYTIVYITKLVPTYMYLPIRHTHFDTKYNVATANSTTVYDILHFSLFP